MTHWHLVALASGFMLIGLSVADVSRQPDPAPLTTDSVCREKAWDEDDPFQVDCPHPAHRIESLKTGVHTWIVCRCPKPAEAVLH